MRPKYYPKSYYVPLADRSDWNGEVEVLASGLDPAPVGGRMKGRGRRVANSRKAKAGV